MKTIWLHGIVYGSVFLKEVPVLKETPRLYNIKDCTESGWRRQISKDDKTISSTREEAITRLRRDAAELIEFAEEKLAIAKDCAAIVEKFASEVSK